MDPLAKEVEMRRGYGWAVAIFATLVLVGVGIAAYNVGVTEGLERGGDGVEIVRHVGGPGYGFFPFFPFLFFPLVFLAIFAFKGAWWGRRWNHDHGHDHPHGPGGPDRWERRVEEVHRRLHEGEAGGASAGGEPSG
jgi:hypothetical protein